LSVIVMLPVRDHTAVGVNVTLIAHADPAAREVPQVFVCEKSPVATMPLILRVPLPVLLSVMVCGELLAPTKVPPKLRLDPPPVGNVPGENVATPAVPTPVTLAVCGLPEALSSTSKVSDSVPVFVGVKLTLIVQLAPAARLCVQV